MEIYPSVRFLDVNTGSPLSREQTAYQDAFYVEYNDLAVRRYGLYVLDDELKVRDTCYCCSCPETGGSDPYCRNHGFAGTRPCRTHEMPGAETDEGVMPETVQTERARVWR